MRLTLRTLLAYRDRVLNPTDRGDLHARIQKSEFASNLLRRVDAVAHRQGLGSPPVIGKGPGGDPNSVAEYLDDALQAAQVPEFERVCLVSDAQLSELVHCHEMLSTALTTKVHVPHQVQETAMRIADPKFASELHQSRHMHQASSTKQPSPNTQSGGTKQPDSATQSTSPDLRIDAGQRIAGPHLPPKHADGASTHPRKVAVDVRVPMLVSAGTSIKPQGLDLESDTLPHEVPQYLTARNRGRWLAPIAVGGLLALLCLLVWQTLGPMENITALFTASPVAPVPADPTSSKSGVGESNPNNIEQASPLATNQPPSDAPSGTEATGNSSNSNNELPSDTPAPPAASASPNTSAHGENSASLDSNSLNNTPAVSTENANPSATDANATDLLNQLPSEVVTNDVLNRNSVQQTDSPVARWVPQNRDEQLGVVLTQDGNGRRAVATEQDAFGLGTQLLVPGLSRTTLELPGGTRFAHLGPTSGRLVDSPAGKLPTLKLDYGRGLLLSANLPAATAGLRVLDQDGTVRLVQNGRVSIEVAHRITQFGSLAEPTTLQQICVLLPMGAAAEVSIDGVPNKLVVPVGEGLAITSAGAPKQFPLRRIPTWLRPTSVRPIDRLGETDLWNQLAQRQGEGVELTASLRVAVQDIRPEVAATAARALLSFGEPAIAFQTLARSDMSPHWTNIINHAQQCIASNAFTGQDAIDALLPLSPKTDATVLQQLVLGIKSADLPDNGTNVLVAALESRYLSDRVLALHQLETLTGTDGDFLPHRPSKESLQNWRRKSTSGELQMLQPIGLIRESIAF